MSKVRREDTGSEMSVKRETGLFPLLAHPAHWRVGPGRGPRLIGSFGLEKWISPPKKLVSF